MRRFARYALPPLAYALGIFALSSLTLSGAPSIRGLDKLVHLAIYAGLTFLAARALHGYGTGAFRAAVAAVVLAAAYGGTDELHQGFTPGRSPEVWDWVADTIGAVLAAALWYALARSRRQKEART